MIARVDPVLGVIGNPRRKDRRWMGSTANTLNWAELCVLPVTAKIHPERAVFGGCARLAAGPDVCAAHAAGLCVRRPDSDEAVPGCRQTLATLAAYQGRSRVPARTRDDARALLPARCVGLGHLTGVTATLRRRRRRGTSISGPSSRLASLGSVVCVGQRRTRRRR